MYCSKRWWQALETKTELYLTYTWHHIPVVITLGAVAFLPTHIARIIFTFVSFNLTILAIFKIFFHFSLLTLKLHFKILICVNPNNPSVSDRTVTEFTKADLFSLRRQLLTSYNLCPKHWQLENLLLMWLQILIQLVTPFQQWRLLWAPW